MADVVDVVKKFGENQNTVSRPSAGDQIAPPLAALAGRTYASFHQQLCDALGAAGISADIPFNGLRQCVAWTNVSILVINNKK